MSRQTIPKRVLLWSPKGAGLHYGGPGTSAFRLYSTDQEKQIQLTLVHGSEEQEHLDLFNEQVLLSRLSPSPFSQIQFILKAGRWMRANASRFDVFHGLQGFELTIQPALQAKRSGLPAVVKLVSHRSDLASKSGLRGMLKFPERRRKVIEKLDAIIAISDSIVNELLEYGIPEKKIVKIPNGVDTNQFHPIEPSQKLLQKKHLAWPDMPTLLFVGALVKRKNPALLIDVIRELRLGGRDVHLVLAGPEREPLYAKYLRELIEKHGISRQVTFVGHVKDIAPFYQAADFFALPSSNEGMPNALLEAMATGLPSLCTPVSGVADLIRDGVEGRLLPPQVGPFVEALREYADTPSLRLEHGVSARHRVVEQFSTSVVFQRHLELFDQVIRG